MAHELRNPLASLKGHAQLLLESLDDDPARKAKAERVVTEAMRLEGLTRDLLSFVREGPLDLRDVAPAHLVRRLADAFPRASIEPDLAAAPETMRVDEARISLALENLVRNALQAAEDAPVKVRIERSDGATTIDVCDRGRGLPKGEEERIFEPFVTTRTRGTGLGLAVARRAVEQHGGTIRGETLADGGARFRIVLPREPA
jgi:two-component system, NtrC family, sensor histidine kinase HydH